MLSRLKRVLFLVHVEPEYEEHFPDNLPYNILSEINFFDKVIALVTTFDKCEPAWWLPKDSIPNMEIWEWDYGPSPGSYECPEHPFPIEYSIDDWKPHEDCEDCDYARRVIKASGHDFAFVPPELDELMYFLDSNCEIVVGGGFEDQCLADWRDVLEHVDLNYMLDWGMIYG